MQTAVNKKSLPQPVFDTKTGLTHRSIKAAARSTGLDRSTISLNRKRFVRLKPPPAAPARKPVIWGDRQFPSIYALARFLGVENKHIAKAMANKWCVRGKPVCRNSDVALARLSGTRLARERTPPPAASKVRRAQFWDADPASVAASGFHC